jgi:hypothetical protein
LNWEKAFMARKDPATKMTGRIGDEAVRAKTGKTWSQWFDILDKAGAKRISHKEIATFCMISRDSPAGGVRC